MTSGTGSGSGAGAGAGAGLNGTRVAGPRPVGERRGASEIVGRAPAALLRVRDLAWRAVSSSRAGEVIILERVSFEAAPGEFIALMGRNGAGKSTLLDLIAGLRTPAAGEVALDGRPMGEWASADRARVMAHLPQVVRADMTFSVEQLVLMGRYPQSDRWFDTAADRAAAEQAMHRCGCLVFRERAVSTLSGGERQRVLLAACLAQAPRLLLLDEPATFLDVDQQLHCFELLREEADRGAACLAVTHDINLALTFCTRILVLAEHTLARDVAVEDAAEQPDWLTLFSRRLAVMKNPAGRPWVWYA
jgi:iron complex transport system ATP-binding protein